MQICNTKRVIFKLSTYVYAEVKPIKRLRLVNLTLYQTRVD